MSQEQLLPYSQWIYNYLIQNGFSEFWASVCNTTFISIVGIFLVFLLHYLAKTFVVQLFKTFSNRSKTTFDDLLVQSNFPRFMAHILPWLLMYKFLPVIFHNFPKTKELFQELAWVYFYFLCVYILRSVLKTIRNYLITTNKSLFDKPLESYTQLIMLFAWSTAIFLSINEFNDFSFKSLATLSAASAIILLIFKDTILGFIASIQISVNDIVRIGDWITFSKFGADGNVTEINLATVRVQNFDNTYTTIPTYSLIADSFQNWRGMLESDGRRIKRHLLIKQNSVKFLTEKELISLKKIELISDYLSHKQDTIDKFNEKNKVDKSLLINGRNQTNLGIFRHYIEAFLYQHPHINTEMLLMVRQLPITELGLPLEVFCFSKEKDWQKYERIQSFIFDHIIAAAKYFDLELFENPTGLDIQKGIIKTQN